jgi:hypothetical protein
MHPGMIKEELKGINQSLMGATLKVTKRSLKGVAHMKDKRAQLIEHLPGSLPKEEALTIKEPLHLLLPQVALKLKIPRSQL